MAKIHGRFFLYESQQKFAVIKPCGKTRLFFFLEEETLAVRSVDNLFLFFEKKIFLQ